MTARKLISSGSHFEKLAGYSRAVVDGDWVFVSGSTGMDYAAGTISDDVAEQTHQTFRNINAALAEAGATLADVVRVRVFVAERGEYFGDIRPANTTAIASLVDARMKVEIEVTAHKRGGD